MPWVPEGAPPNLLAAVPVEKWLAWADGGPLGPAPHREESKVFAIELNTSVNSPDGTIQYKKGMQGRAVEVRNTDSGLQAKIFIEGVTEGKESNHQWIPVRFLQKGKPWQTDIAKWKLDFQLATASFNSRNWESAVPTYQDNTVLGKSVNLMLAALEQSPPPFVAAKLTQFFASHSTASVGTAIIRGIKEAGLYNILSSPNAFTFRDLINATRYRINENDHSCDEAGIYARFHHSSKKVSHWKPDSTYCYVGKTVDMGDRFVGHRTTSSSYGDLTRNSTSLEMIALCILSENVDVDTGLFLVAEQIMLCLLQCYKATLLRFDANAETEFLLRFVGPARHMTDIANEVFRKTGWQGGVDRRSFGIMYGANCSSPLLEYSMHSDRHLFIRTDRLIMDRDTGVAVPMAFYRRANRTKLRDDVYGTSAAKAKSKYKYGKVQVFSKAIFSPFRAVLTLGFKITPEKSGADLPPAGATYELVFEVRKDGSRHPHAWARLPEIGRFQNHDQANSWAARIEWEWPPNSGTWRFKYLQWYRIFGMASDTVPGAFSSYAKSIMFLQWLTESKPNHQHSWVDTIPGAVHCLQADYKFLDQRIVFTKQKADIVMLPGNARSDAAIMTHMRDPRFGLLRVNGEFGKFDTPSFKRSACDTCMILEQYLDRMSKSKARAWDSTCKQFKNTKVCTNCRLFGRPCCSWTNTLKSDSFKYTRTAGELSITARASKGLISLPVSTIPEYMQSFTQELRSIESSRDIEDDGSDRNSDSDEPVADEEDDVDE